MAKIKRSQAFPKHPPNKLSITNSQRRIPISADSVQNAVSFLLEGNNIECEEMAVHFVGKKRISSLHNQFFDDPTTTDCITFPVDPLLNGKCSFLGEVFICPQTAKEYVLKHGGDLYEEITLYVVHGFLHLLGYDDQTEKQRKQMRSLEKKWLLALAKNNLIVTP